MQAKPCLRYVWRIRRRLLLALVLAFVGYATAYLIWASSARSFRTVVRFLSYAEVGDDLVVGLQLEKVRVRPFPAEPTQVVITQTLVAFLFRADGTVEHLRHNGVRSTRFLPQYLKADSGGVSVIMKDQDVVLPFDANSPTPATLEGMVDMGVLVPVHGQFQTTAGGWHGQAEAISGAAGFVQLDGRDATACIAWGHPPSAPCEGLKFKEVVDYGEEAGATEVHAGFCRELE